MMLSLLTLRRNKELMSCYDTTTAQLSEKIGFFCVFADSVGLMIFLQLIQRTIQCCCVTATLNIRHEYNYCVSADSHNVSSIK